MLESKSVHLHLLSEISTLDESRTVTAKIFESAAVLVSRTAMHALSTSAFRNDIVAYQSRPTRVYAMMMSFRTSVTPGAAHAVAAATRLSCGE